MAIDENYLNSLSIEELRNELRYFAECHYGLVYALRDLPIFPSPFILKHISSAAKYPDDFNLGKKLQKEYKLDVIPYKHECEGGAGLWYRIRNGLMIKENLNEQ